MGGTAELASMTDRHNSSFLLYGGSVRLTFDQLRHGYFVQTRNKGAGSEWSPVEIVPSATTILRVIAKDALVQWSANCAVEYVQQHIDKQWQYDEIRLNEILREAKYAHRRKAQQACDIGTLVHNWVEELITSGNPPEYPANIQAANSCSAAYHWICSHDFTPLNTEMCLYSKKHGYAGKLDQTYSISTVNGHRCIVDWKTSKAVYPEYRLQAAAYAKAYTEQTGIEVLDRWIIRLDKDTGMVDPVHLHRNTLVPDFKAFLAARTLYARLKEIQDVPGMTD